MTKKITNGRQPERKIAVVSDPPSGSENDQAPSFDEVLQRLAATRPALAEELREAHSRRTRAIAARLEGVRLEGLDVLLVYLAKVGQAWERDDGLRQLAPLVDRLRRDFYTAAEATLSGYLAVAADAMRDAMEVENLIRDFVADPSQVPLWLARDPRDPPGPFRPVSVRARIRAAGLASPSANEKGDYAAHSMALHVNSGLDRVELFRKGFVKEGDFFADAGFWEIFEHARRVIGALDLARQRLAARPRRIPTGSRVKAVRRAWERTQEMQLLFTLPFSSDWPR